MSGATEDPRVYWCTLPTREFVEAARRRIGLYRQWLDTSGRLGRMQRAWNCAFGHAPDGQGDAARIIPSGEQGELLEVTTNEFMGLGTQTLALLLNNKPAVTPIANNADYSSMASVKVAAGLLDAYDKILSLPERDAEAAWLAVFLSEAWQVWGWDETKGEAEVADEESAVMQGDATAQTCSPVDVAYDGDTQDIDRLQWFAYRSRINRHDAAKTLEGQLAMLPPEGAVELRLALEGAIDELKNGGRLTVDPDKDALFDVLSTKPDSANAGEPLSPDLTWCWEARVLPSPACPPGRLVRFVNPECVLYDSARPDAQGLTGGYPYSELHAHQLKPDLVPGSIAGNTHHWDLLSLQQALDNCLTQMVSAANAGGVQNLWAPPGNDISPVQVTEALNLVQTPQKPERIEGPTIDPQSVGLANYVVEMMRRRIGFNDVAVGEPSKGMPAQLAALLQAQAVQYHNRLQASYARLIERGRTGLIKLLQRFANTRRVVLMAGKGNAWALKEWSGEDIADIARVSVEEVPALLKTTAGKMQIADLLLERGIIANRQEYLTLATTGRLEPLFEGQETNLMRIQRDKELLMEGVGLPPVDVFATDEAMLADPTALPIFAAASGAEQPFLRPLITDTHWLDIPEYLSVIASPQARAAGNDAVQNAVLGVVQYKLQLWRKMDPLLQTLQGCPPELIQRPMVPGMPPGAGAPPPGAPPPAGPSGPPKVPGLPASGPNVRAPKPPPNPLTGEQAPPPIAA